MLTDEQHLNKIQEMYWVEEGTGERLGKETRSHNYQNTKYQEHKNQQYNDYS